MLSTKRVLHFNTDTRGRKRIDPEPRPKATVNVGRIPRISKLMALAIHFQELLQDGVVADQSDLARLSHVTQPRISQIMNLLLLSPEIQDEILHLPKISEIRFMRNCCARLRLRFVLRGKVRLGILSAGRILADPSETSVMRIRT